jgi:hypothetical protein
MLTAVLVVTWEWLSKALLAFALVCVENRRRTEAAMPRLHLLRRNVKLHHLLSCCCAGMLLPAGSTCDDQSYCIAADGSGQPINPSPPDNGSNGGNNNGGGRNPHNTVSLDDLLVNPSARLQRRQQRAQQQQQQRATPAQDQGQQQQQSALSQMISGMTGLSGGSGGNSRTSSSVQLCSYQLKAAGTVCCSSRGLDRRCNGRSTCTGTTAECT